MDSTDWHLIAALLASLVASAPSRAQRIAIWDAPVPRDMLAADPAELGRLFAGHGYDVTPVTTEDITDNRRLSPDALPLLVVSALGIYPHEGLPLLEEYLKAGGALISLGGLPFDRPLAKVNGRWQFVGLPDAPPGEVKVIADFEAGLPDGIATMGGTEGERMTYRTIADDRGGRCLEVTTADLRQYEYVTFDVEGTGEATFTILHFRARADENTPLMGLEMNEQDRSRWKLVLPLSTTWRDYTMYIPHFLSYATEGRGTPGDYLHPERLTRLCIGFITKMVGPGPHTLYLDDLQRWQFTPPVPDALTLSRDTVEATAYHYGNYVKVPPAAAPPVRLFRSAQRFENATLHGTGHVGILSAAEGGAKDVKPVNRYAGWLISPSADDGPAVRPAVMALRRTARVVPILTARAPDGTDLGPAAFAALYHDGPLAGASWACFALETNDLLADPHLAQAVLGAADFLLRRPRLLRLSPTFAVVDGRAGMTLTATIAAPKAAAADAKVALGYHSFDVFGSEDFEVALPPGGRTHVTIRLGSTDFDTWRYGAVATLSAGAEPVDRITFTVNAMDVLSHLCDFFVQAQRDDGAISGYGYVDQRAARGLLAMYEISGQEAYRDAAIRWGDKELREQREDGGYRMGYGITGRGESCYVADGGEIAIGIARLVSYVPPDRRQAYIDSLRRYFEYRESFRLPDGSIAVGWVFDPRYTQQGLGPRLEKPVRSDKGVDFVIKCSLASAAALPHLTGRPEDREMALRDARRFLQDNPTAYSTFGEAAQWAHYLIQDEEVRAGLARCMTETLVPFVAKPNGWWYAAEGRSGVTLGALQYYYTQIEHSPEALAGIMRGLYYMCADDSPSGLLRVLQRRPTDPAEWRYLCFSAVSLAEVLRPLVTMQSIAGRTGRTTAAPRGTAQP